MRKWRENKMTDQQKQRIMDLSSEEKKYGKIAEELGLTCAVILLVN